MSKDNDATQADSALIMWLLTESSVSRYRIAKDIGISEATISRVARGETTVQSIRFGTAQKLSAYAESVKQQEAKGVMTDGETIN